MKRIIRFAGREEYLAFIRYVRQHPDEYKDLREMRQIDLIYAVSCRIKSLEPLKNFRGVQSIEDDSKIDVHFLRDLFPFSLPSPKAFKTYAKIQSLSIPWGVRSIHAPKAWKHTKGNHVHIGVVDTGVDYSHPDLRASLGQGFNCIQSHLPPNDDNGHGTHICGTIAANAATTGIRGVAPNAVLHPVKAFDHQGSAYVSDIIKAIDWCASNRMDIINMSFGMQTRSTAFLDAIKNAYQQGITIISSSGNEGKLGSIDYPARFKNTIAVGAVNKKRKIASFSNKGSQVDIYAPGEKIYSTWTGGRYTILNGTSMATSHVTGTVALMLSLNPKLTPYQIKKILQQTSLPLIGKTGKKLSRKALNCYKAVMQVKK